MLTLSFSVEAGTGIYIHLSHKTGTNANADEVFKWLNDNVFKNTKTIKLTHNLAFETMFLYALDITIAPPVYDTMLSSMMTLKSNNEF